MASQPPDKCGTHPEAAIFMFLRFIATAFTIGRHPGSCRGQDLWGIVCLLSIGVRASEEGWWWAVPRILALDILRSRPSLWISEWPELSTPGFAAFAVQRSETNELLSCVSVSWNCEIAEHFHMLRSRFNAVPVTALLGPTSGMQGHFKMLSISREN